MKRENLTFLLVLILVIVFCGSFLWFLLANLLTFLKQ